MSIEVWEMFQRLINSFAFPLLPNGDPLLLPPQMVEAGGLDSIPILVYTSPSSSAQLKGI